MMVTTVNTTSTSVSQLPVKTVAPVISLSSTPTVPVLKDLRVNGINILIQTPNTFFI